MNNAQRLRMYGWTPQIVRERLANIRAFQREYRAQGQPGYVYRQLNAAQYKRHRSMLAILTA